MKRCNSLLDYSNGLKHHWCTKIEHDPSENHECECGVSWKHKGFSVFEAKENNVTVRFRHDELTHKGVMKFHKGDLIILDEEDFQPLGKTEKPFGI